MLPNQLLRFSEGTGLISVMTFPRRVIWMDRFVLRTCSTSEEQFALNCETGICFMPVVISPLIGHSKTSAPAAPDEHLVAQF
jgi:hypothetical protein